MGTVRRLLGFGISVTLTGAFFINLCSLIFRCGCHSLWAGADAMCNVHHVTGPHCPFCSHGQTGYALVMALVSAPQLAVSLAPRWSQTIRILVALALFPAMMLFVGLMVGWYDGYWR